MDTDTAWQLWGERDPYYSVLTDPRYRAAAMTAAAKGEFFVLGQHQAEHVVATCRRQFANDFAPRRILDFGCGVGRLLIPFAAIANEVVGMDIAPSMLDEARRNCEAAHIGNVQLVRSDDEFANATGEFDLVHSSIVLQHIEIARGRRLFQRLVQKIRPGGCGAIHATFGWTRDAETFGQPPPVVLPPITARSRARAWLRQWFKPVPIAEPEPDDGDPEMQMNYYNLSELHFVLMQSGVRRVYSELTDHGGALGAMLFFQVEQ